MKIETFSLCPWIFIASTDVGRHIPCSKVAMKRSYTMTANKDGSAILSQTSWTNFIHILIKWSKHINSSSRYLKVSKCTQDYNFNLMRRKTDFYGSIPFSAEPSSLNPPSKTLNNISIMQRNISCKVLKHVLYFNVVLSKIRQLMEENIPKKHHSYGWCVVWSHERTRSVE